MEKKTGIIYKATSPSGKVYIGQTIQKMSGRRNKHYSDAFNKQGSLYHSKFSRAIRKYGKENFIWNIMYSNIPISHINSMEVVIIELYNSYYSGYNSTYGGGGSFGYKQSSAAKAKIPAIIMNFHTLSRRLFSFLGFVFITFSSFSKTNDNAGKESVIRFIHKICNGRRGRNQFVNNRYW